MYRIHILSKPVATCSTVTGKLQFLGLLQLAAKTRPRPAVLKSGSCSEALELTWSLKAGVWPAMPRLAPSSQLATGDTRELKGQTGLVTPGMPKNIPRTWHSNSSTSS